MKLKPGDTVRVKGERRTAKVRSILIAVNNGVLLDKSLGGYRSWDADELRLVKRANASKKR